MPLSVEVTQRVQDWGAAALPLLSFLEGSKGEASYEELLRAYDSELARNLPPKDVSIHSCNMGGISASTVTPDNWADGKVMLYIHGGGYISGGPAGYTGLAGHYAKRLGTRVYIPDYRLAPAAPFPAQLDDVTQAYSWLVSEVGARNIVVAGDSAGGAMVVSLQVRARDAGLALPVAAIAISPWADLEMPGESYVSRDGIDPLCTREVLNAFVRLALPDGTASDPEASPVNADLTGLAPTLVQVGDAEVMLSDAIRLANRLADHRVRTSLEVYPDMFHVWVMFTELIPEAREALENGARFLEQARARVST